MSTVEDLVEFACKRNEVPELVNKIHIRNNNRFKTKGGRCQSRPNKHGIYVIELGMHVLQYGTQQQAKEVLIHEVCHAIVAYKFYELKTILKPSSHGLDWCWSMLYCDLEPNVFHNISVPRKKREKIKVRCGCPDGILLGAIRYQRMLKGKKYRCQCCGSFVDSL